MQAVAPNSQTAQIDFTADMFSEKTIAASQLYAQSFLQDYLRQMQKRGKHSIARAQRGKARVAKRKANRK